MDDHYQCTRTMALSCIQCISFIGNLQLATLWCLHVAMVDRLPCKLHHIHSTTTTTSNYNISQVADSGICLPSPDHYQRQNHAHVVSPCLDMTTRTNSGNVCTVTQPVPSLVKTPTYLVCGVEPLLSTEFVHRSNVGHYLRSIPRSNI